jgi:quercetin dioxygenase-like cupin family protein
MPETTHQPVGEYPQPQAGHQLDLHDETERLLQSLDGRGRKSRNLAREAGVSLVLMAMEAGDTVREHAADGVVTIQVLRGRATVTSESGEYDLRAEGLVMFQAGVRHDVRAEERAVILLTVTGGNG